MPTTVTSLLIAALSAALVGCASAPRPTAAPGGQPDEEHQEDIAAPAPAAYQGDDWHDVGLPGKAATRYTAEVKEGREAVAALADRSASMWRRRVNVQPQDLGDVGFSWWVPALPEQASVSNIDREDAAARLLFGFQGDIASLPARTRMMFDLAEALTGEKPPYATLMYVWDAHAPVGSVIVNPRSDRIRKIVVDSGIEGLGRWRDHRRDLRADFRMAFGEEPGRLVSVALMTDSDNTRSQVRAWFGAVKFWEAALLRPCTTAVQALSAEPAACTQTVTHSQSGVVPGTNLNKP